MKRRFKGHKEPVLLKDINRRIEWCYQVKDVTNIESKSIGKILEFIKSLRKDKNLHIINQAFLLKKIKNYIKSLTEEVKDD